MSRRSSLPYFQLAQTLLQSMARESVDRIRGDRHQAPPKVQYMLEYLERHLFDKGLNVDTLKKACGVRDNSVALTFHSHVGQAPKAYISERRLETAAKLLRQSDLKIWQISEVTGYSSLAVFGKAFNRWAGQRPSAYRQEIRDVATPSADTSVGTDDDQFLQKALTGELSDAQAQALIERLLGLYPRRSDTRSGGG